MGNSSSPLNVGGMDTSGAGVGMPNGGGFGGLGLSAGNLQMLSKLFAGNGNSQQQQGQKQQPQQPDPMAPSPMIGPGPAKPQITSPQAVPLPPSLGGQPPTGTMQVPTGTMQTPMMPMPIQSIQPFGNGSGIPLTGTMTPWSKSPRYGLSQAFF